MDPASRNFLLLKLAEVLGVIAAIMIVSTSKSMIYRPVNFKYPEREGRVSISVFLLILAITAFLYLANLGQPPASDTTGMLVRQLLAAVLSLAVVAAALLYRRQPVLSAGWGRRGNLRLGLSIGAMLVLLTIFLRGKTSAIVDGVTGQEGIFLLLLFLISLAEETIFRGYLQLRFVSWFGKPNGWLLTSVLFVIWSLPRLLANPSGFWINLPVLIIQSFVLGWVMHRTGHVAAPVLYRAVSEWLSLLS